MIVSCGERHTNLGGVIGGSKDELRCTVVSRADVGHIWLVLYEYLGAAEVAQLEDSGSRIEKKILGLNISMTDALRMNVCEGAEKLVDVELHFEYRHDCLHLVEVPRRPIHGFWDKLKHEVEVDLIFLLRVSVILCTKRVFLLTRSPLL